MKRMRTLLILFLFCMSFTAICYGQYDIDITLDNYENDTIIIGNYFGDRTLVKDTVYRSEDGNYRLSGDTLENGVYLLLLRPNNKYIQFLVSEGNKKFSIRWDSTKLDGLKIKGSKENDIYNDYIAFLDKQRNAAEQFQERISKAEEAGKEDATAEKELDKIDERVKAEQQRIIKKYPSSLTTQFIKSTLQVDMPEFEGTEKEVNLKQYLYYKKHYFDHIDLGNPSLLRTPFLHQRVDYYIEKLTPKDPDSIIASIDYLLGKMEPAEETYRFYTSYFTNKYANMNIVGMDAVYVHMVDNYYLKGKAPWVDEEGRGKMKEDADNLRPILIGKTFPDIVTFKADGTPVEIRKVDADYTVVIFWEYSCGHCTKSMPHVIDFYNAYQDKSVKVVSICTKGREDTQKCIDAIPEKGMEKFINTFDEYQRYRRKVVIRSTPKIFILDKDKKILIKDIPAEELENVMESIQKIDKERAVKE